MTIWCQMKLGEIIVQAVGGTLALIFAAAVMGGAVGLIGGFAYLTFRWFM